MRVDFPAVITFLSIVLFAIALIASIQNLSWFGFSPIAILAVTLLGFAFLFRSRRPQP